MRQLCGSVYTWNCAGELYAIECSLCEERPLCALSEFPEHMDVWHSDWQALDEDPATPAASAAATAAASPAPQPEDELMQEVLAEQGINGEDNELKQQLVLELNSSEEELLSDDEELIEELQIAEERPTPVESPENMPDSTTNLEVSKVNHFPKIDP